MLSWSEIERVNMIISRKFESGRSMVEMMGYMAIAIVLTASVGQLVYKAFNDYKFSKASIQLTELANVISRAGAIEPSYDNVVAMISGTSERALDNQEGRKMIPSSFRVSNIAGARRIYHAFGGLVTLGSTNPEDSLNAGAKFMITFAGLNKKQCVDLALKDWSKNKYSDLDSIVINDQYKWYWPIYGVSEGDAVAGLFTFPVTREAVIGLEDGGQCRDEDNTVQWFFN